MGRVRRWVMLVPILLLAGACGEPIPGANETLAAAEATGPEPAAERADHHDRRPDHVHDGSTDHHHDQAARGGHHRGDGRHGQAVPERPLQRHDVAAHRRLRARTAASGRRGRRLRRYGGVTATTAAGVTVELRVYPREQYLGEMMQVGFKVERPEGISVTSMKLDYGNGHVVTFGPQNNWYCGTAGDAGNSNWYTYPAPGTFRISATVTVVNCMGGIPGGVWIGPHFPPPAGLIGPWFPEPHQAVTAGMDILQRPDRHPRPVGPPPGP